MLDNPNRPLSVDSTDQKKDQHQAGNSGASLEGKKCAAPDYPPATPRAHRTDSINFGEGEGSKTQSKPQPRK